MIVRSDEWTGLKDLPDFVKPTTTTPVPNLASMVANCDP